MGRASTIADTAIQPRVDFMLDDGVPYSEISRRTGASLSAVGRYALSRKSQLAKVADDEPNITDAVLRLIEIADHAQSIRRQSRVAGTPVAQSRAIRAETEVLIKLVEQLGVDDMTVGRILEQSTALVRVVAEHVTSDRSAIDLIERLDAVDGLSDVAEALRERARA